MTNRRMEIERKVRDHFHADAERFDSMYRPNKGLFSKFIGAFPEIVMESDLPFDASTANGFFDYVAEPIPIIAKMREMTRGKIIMSFPKAIEWRVPVRRVRFWSKDTPLFLYRENQVKAIL